MAIGAISSLSGTNYYGQMASGSRINKAADDAAGMTIAEGMKGQAGAMKANMENAQSGIGAVKIADGALSGITDYLQEIKRLSIKAANGTNSQADKEAIQSQIDQYKQGIVDSVNNAQYNTLNLLDGSFDGVKIAISPDGSGKDISIGEMSLEKLGLKDYDVTGSFDMSKVDDAIAFVSKNRSNAGAQQNALESSYSYLGSSLENLNSADSRIEDLDYAKASSDLKKQQLLSDIAIQMQKSKEEQEKRHMNGILGIQ